MKVWVFLLIESSEFTANVWVCASQLAALQEAEIRLAEMLAQDEDEAEWQAVWAPWAAELRDTGRLFLTEDGERVQFASQSNIEVRIEEETVQPEIQA
jgi:hypothetical protein